MKTALTALGLIAITVGLWLFHPGAAAVFAGCFALVAGAPARVGEAKP